jgi:hypothetical protein
MGVEISDDGLSVIGNGVVAIRFYDDNRVLQKTIYLNSDNELVAGGVTIEAPETSPEAALIAAVLSAQPGGGTRQNYGWLANSRQLFGQASGYWTENSIVVGNWGVTPTGGPYITLDGANDYLTVADAAWQEVGANSMVVWHWVKPSTEAAHSDCVIVGKTAIDNTGWRLGITPSNLFPLDPLRPAWRFSVNGTGDDDDMIDMFHVSVNPGVWTFVGAFYEPGQRIRMYIGQTAGGWMSAAPDLVMLEHTADIPASIYNGTADLRIGANSDGTPGLMWRGRVGPGAMWLGPTAGSVGTYLQTMFDLTKARYGG